MLSIITIGIYTLAFFLINNSEIKDISINLFYINVIGLILIFFVAFILYIGKPLENISREVKALLT